MTEEMKRDEGQGEQPGTLGRPLQLPFSTKKGWLGEIGDIACYDPQLAYSLLQPIRPDLIGWGEPACGWGWEIVNLVGSFSGVGAPQSVPAQQFGIVEADLWVRRVTYTVRRPNAFAGSIFKAQSDYFNKLNPNIDFTFLVNSYCRYVISPDPTPLENIEMVFECVCPVGFVLGCNANIKAEYTLNRALAGDEVPYEVIISLHATRLPTNYNACSRGKCIDALRSIGILPY